MKNLFLSLSLLGILFFTASSTSAKGLIFYSSGEKIELIQKLPADITVNEDEHVNLGVMYKQFSIFWIPMWNYGETKYVLINDKKDTYYDPMEEDIEMLKTEYNVNIPEKPAIGFWNRIGGKIIWGVIILTVVYGWWSSRKENDETENP